ncbi:MAG: glucohydrolase, partial [Bacilli bacterium]|nr:glucohydrolase [Bacilli bacterium]
SPERAYYFFRKGKKVDGKLMPPNNWASFNSIPAWTNVPGTDDFYLHLFAAKQPDLNWSNPAVRKSMIDVALFYLEMGADGFRIDAMAHLSKDLSFSDSTLPDQGNGFILDMGKFSNRPEVGEYLKEFSDAVNEKYNPCLLGEAGGGISPEQAAGLADIENGPVSMIFNFDTAWNNGAFGSIDKSDEEIKTNLVELKRNFMRWYDCCAGKADMPIYWCDHDHPRVLSQYGSLKYRTESAKCLLTTLLFLYGTPFIYYGDEIGMSNVNYDRPEDFFSDSATRSEVAMWREKGYPDWQITRFLNRCSRVNSRTPMQWDRGENAGFSKKGSVNKVNQNYLEGVNIYDQMRDPWSILNFYQYAIWKRRDPVLNDAVLNGRLEILDMMNPDVFAYRHAGNCNLIVVSNFSEKEVEFPFYWPIGEVILQNYDNVYLRDHVLHLRPFESFLLKVRNDE